jgi:hypothetical protein
MLPLPPLLLLLPLRDSCGCRHAAHRCILVPAFAGRGAVVHALEGAGMAASQ